MYDKSDFINTIRNLFLHSNAYFAFLICKTFYSSLSSFALCNMAWLYTFINEIEAKHWWSQSFHYYYSWESTRYSPQHWIVDFLFQVENLLNPITLCYFIAAHITPLLHNLNYLPCLYLDSSFSFLVGT